VYFEIQEAVSAPTPVVVEVPHAGLAVDPEALATLVAPARALGFDADLMVDELFADAPTLGATLLSARVSRYVCDLNRSEHDVDGRSVIGGGAAPFPHGLVWRATTDDLPALSRPLPRTEYERRLRDIYRPYHAALQRLLRATRERFGYVILLAGHSMPSRGRRGHSDPGRVRADVVPGTQGRTTACDAVIDCVERTARARGFSVAHDEPYRGGYTTATYGKPRDGVHAVQVEIGRSLYMDEATLCKNTSNFKRVRDLCGAMVAELGALELA
jgi:N-formylglutamate amidohydrolase